MNDKTIYLAGGCFWGLQKFIDGANGIIETVVGYANGPYDNPSYEEVCKNSGHAETCKITYDPQILPLPTLLDRFLDVIDPFSVNKQGGDVGVQYRTGIYYVDNDDVSVIESAIRKISTKSDKPCAVEVKRLENFSPAEEYHQKYLKKNPHGYCHITRSFQ